MKITWNGMRLIRGFDYLSCKGDVIQLMVRPHRGELIEVERFLRGTRRFVVVKDRIPYGTFLKLGESPYLLEV